MAIEQKKKRQMIINAHAHLFHNPNDLDGIFKSGIFEQVWLLDLPYGEWAGKSLAAPEEILDVAKSYKGFFIPFGYLDFRKPPEMVEELHDKGFVGLKAISPAKPYDDLSYFPYYEKAEKLNMPILFHTGLVAARPYKVLPDGLGMSSVNMQPATLFPIAGSFPKLTIIGAHLGHPWLEETTMVIGSTSNLYFDISGGHMIEYQEWLLKHLHYSAPLPGGAVGGFADRLLMGVDAFHGSAEIHGDIFEAVNKWERFFERQRKKYIWGNEIEKIMSGNARKIMANLGNGK